MSYLDYDEEIKSIAEVMAAIDIIRQLRDNGLVSEKEYDYIYKKYISSQQNA